MRCTPCIALSFLLAVGPALAAQDDLLSLPLEALTRLEVRVASGTPRTLRSAPSVASVITAQEMEVRGVQTMDEALEAVPGLHVSHGGLAYRPRYFFRGIFSNGNPHTLVMVDGLPMNSAFLGSPLPGWPGVPVQAIERIEIVRGPGSAVFGADAFGGVINVITKGAADIPANRATLGYGSFDTGHAALLQRATLGSAQAAISLDFRRTSGDDSIIAADWASGFDQLFGTSTSFAPGSVNRGHRALEARADLATGPWRLRASWLHRWDLENGAGLSDALDPQGRFHADFGMLDLGWQRQPEGLPHWQLEARTGGQLGRIGTSRPLYVLPPGFACYPGSPSCLPQGLQQEIAVAEAQARSSFAAVYTGWHAHRLRFGAGFAWDDIYETTERRNADTSTAVPTALPGMTEFTDTPGVFQPEAQRTSSFVMVQDEWRLAPDWELTAGLRHDHYSDFGSTTNPRVALFWQTLPALTTRLMYGEAFRAPSFSELYVQGPVFGNPALKPEVLHSAEIAFSWRPQPTLVWDLNLFRNHIHDFIQFDPDPAFGGLVRARNAGDFEGAGFETELRWQLPVPVQLLANFSTARMEDTATGLARGQVPRQTVVLRAVWDVASRWQLTGQLMHFGDYERQDGDPRPDMQGYRVFDATLRHRLSKRLDLNLVGTNLFDADAREASNGPAPPQTNARIPGDLPQAG
ncbi:MAG: TonB-dependent receptor, partial [Moraxellaceae bacterium]|nr:TonB-dependent receptor [Moraxellaceae bacterium]